MKLSVIIPSFNEEARIAKTLRAVDAYLKRQDYDYEILVVSDGSKDTTCDVVRGLEESIAFLRLIANKENHGKGFVVRQGMLEATGDVRLFMDADNATTIDHVERMFPHFKSGADVVICSRDIPGSIVAVSQSLFRRRLGDVFNLIVQTFSGLWGLWDTQCGFKAFSAQATLAVFKQARINRWAFDVELLVIAKLLGYKIVEVPVTWVNDPHSKVKFSGMVKMLLEVMQIRWNVITGKYEKK